MTIARYLYCRMNGIRPRALDAAVASYAQCEFWSADRLRQMQESALAETLDFAIRNVPWYRDSVRPDPSPCGDVGLETLADWPILRRKDVLDAADCLLPEMRIKDTRIGHSSGTSGRRVRSVHDAPSRLSIWALRSRALAWYGVRPWDRHLLLGAVTQSLAKRLVLAFVDPLAARYRQLAPPFESEDVQAAIDRCIRFKPRLIVGQPWMLYRMAYVSRQTGLDLRRAEVNLILAASERLTPFADRILQETFGCPVMIEYGCSEVGSMGHRCPAGTIHLNPENCVVELVDSTGRAVPPGTPGEVVLTALRNRAMPLIRYAVGDVAVRAVRECACGRQPGFSGLLSIEGRTDDVWRSGDGAWITSHDEWFPAIQEALARAGFWESQWIQRDVRTIELRVRPNQRPPDAVMVQIRRRLEDKIGGPVDILWKGQPVQFARSGKLAVLSRESMAMAPELSPTGMSRG